jgi:hypothetical protein
VLRRIAFNIFGMASERTRHRLNSLIGLALALAAIDCGGRDAAGKSGQTAPPSNKASNAITAQSRSAIFDVPFRTASVLLGQLVCIGSTDEHFIEESLPSVNDHLEKVAVLR